MTIKEVLTFFHKNYPKGKIVQIPEDDPTEIICELGIHPNHPKSGVAIAAIKQSAPHYHKVMTEVYEVKQGSLTLIVDDKEVKLNQGDSYIVKPGQIHSACGNFTLVKVTSTPAWTPEDHHLI